MLVSTGTIFLLVIRRRKRNPVFPLTEIPVFPLTKRRFLLLAVKIVAVKNLLGKSLNTRTLLVPKMTMLVSTGTIFPLVIRRREKIPEEEFQTLLGKLPEWDYQTLEDTRDGKK